MTGQLPSIEAPAPGTCCPHCREELRIAGFCASCFELWITRHAQARDALIAEARRRARAWYLERAQG